MKGEVFVRRRKEFSFDTRPLFTLSTASVLDAAKRAQKNKSKKSVF